jgi:hypothetical protein
MADPYHKVCRCYCLFVVNNDMGLPLLLSVCGHMIWFCRCYCQFVVILWYGSAVVIVCLWSIMIWICHCFCPFVVIWYGYGQFSYPLLNIVSFLFRLEFRFRSRDFFLNLFPVWQPYCWRFWSAIVVHIHTSTINAPELRERNITTNRQ